MFSKCIFSRSGAMWARGIILGAVSLQLMGWAQASVSRVGELEVRMASAGTPCFTISEPQERRSGAPEFQSISVVQSWPGAKVVMWTMAMPGARTFPLSFRMCIPYGGRVPVLPQTPAAALVAGRPYEVTIAVRAPPTGEAPHSYRARFCLLGAPPSEVRTLGAATNDAKARRTCGD
jgi:hypothetical protein